MRWPRSSCPLISGDRMPAVRKPNLSGDIEMKFRKLLVISLFVMALITAVFADGSMLLGSFLISPEMECLIAC
jgi:hypothetical protein